MKSEQTAQAHQTKRLKQSQQGKHFSLEEFTEELSDTELATVVGGAIGIKVGVLAS